MHGHLGTIVLTETYCVAFFWYSPSTCINCLCEITYLNNKETGLQVVSHWFYCFKSYEKWYDKFE